jgi:uncharacterized membrane protein YbhN (UPF0104 family)
MANEPKTRPAGGSASLRWPVWGGLTAVTFAVVFLAVPPLAGVPAHLIEGCAKWIALAAILELLSVLGFLVVFKLVFGGRMTWRRSLPAGLRALGASTVLPAGGLLGPAAGAWSAGPEHRPLSRLSRSAMALVVLTNAPGVIVLSALGLMLWLGWPAGPHGVTLTLVPAGLALAVFAVAWHTRPAPAAEFSGSESVVRGRALSTRFGQLTGLVRGAVTDAHGLAVTGDWKLVGALGYYAFDNAVLWAAFRAYGPAPPFSVIVMGYLIGSLATALPSPAGLGAVEGGLIGGLVLYGPPIAPAAAAVLLYRGLSLGLPLALGALAWTCGPVARLRRPAIPNRRSIVHDEA